MYPWSRYRQAVPRPQWFPWFRSVAPVGPFATPRAVAPRAVARRPRRAGGDGGVLLPAPRRRRGGGEGAAVGASTRAAAVAGAPRAATGARPAPCRRAAPDREHVTRL